MQEGFILYVSNGTKISLHVSSFKIYQTLKFLCESKFAEVVPNKSQTHFFPKTTRALNNMKLHSSRNI